MPIRFADNAAENHGDNSPALQRWEPRTPKGKSPARDDRAGSSVPAGLFPHHVSNPALKRWAILKAPLSRNRTGMNGCVLPKSAATMPGSGCVFTKRAATMPKNVSAAPGKLAVMPARFAALRGKGSAVRGRGFHDRRRLFPAAQRLSGMPGRLPAAAAVLPAAGAHGLRRRGCSFRPHGGSRRCREGASWNRGEPAEDHGKEGWHGSSYVLLPLPAKRWQFNQERK